MSSNYVTGTLSGVDLDIYLGKFYNLRLETVGDILEAIEKNLPLEETEGLVCLEQYKVWKETGSPNMWSRGGAGFKIISSPEEMEKVIQEGMIDPSTHCWVPIQRQLYVDESQLEVLKSLDPRTRLRIEYI